MSAIMAIIFYAAAIFILYLVIQAAVRNGINSSEVGRIIKEKQDGEQLKK